MLIFYRGIEVKKNKIYSTSKAAHALSSYHFKHNENLRPAGSIVDAMTQIDELLGPHAENIEPTPSAQTPCS